MLSASLSHLGNKAGKVCPKYTTVFRTGTLQKGFLLAQDQGETIVKMEK